MTCSFRSRGSLRKESLTGGETGIGRPTECDTRECPEWGARPEELAQHLDSSSEDATLTSHQGVHRSSVGERIVTVTTTVPSGAMGLVPAGWLMR